MSFTSEDRLKDAVLPMIRALRPAREIRRQRALERAVSDDGYVKARAILPATSLIIDDESSSITDSNPSSGVWKTYLGTTVAAPSGVWRLKVRAGLCGRLSGSSNLNTQMLINGVASDNFQIPLGAGDLGVVWPRLVVDNVPGGSELSIEVQYRPSAGTATIESGYYEYRLERM